MANHNNSTIGKSVTIKSSIYVGASDYIGCTGKITHYNATTNVYRVTFPDGNYWFYNRDDFNVNN